MKRMACSQVAPPGNPEMLFDDFVVAVWFGSATPTTQTYY